MPAGFVARRPAADQAKLDQISRPQSRRRGARARDRGLASRRHRFCRRSRARDHDGPGGCASDAEHVARAGEAVHGADEPRAEDADAAHAGGHARPEAPRRGAEAVGRGPRRGGEPAQGGALPRVVADAVQGAGGGREGACRDHRRGDGQARGGLNRGGSVRGGCAGGLRGGGAAQHAAPLLAHAPEQHGRARQRVRAHRARHRAPATPTECARAAHRMRARAPCRDAGCAHARVHALRRLRGAGCRAGWTRCAGT